MLSGNTPGHRTFFLCGVCVFLAGVGILLWSLRTPSQTLKTVYQPTSPEVQSSGDTLPEHLLQSAIIGKQPSTETPPDTADSLDYDVLTKVYLANNSLSTFDYQELADFIASRGGKQIDFRGIFREIYQDFYPNTDPEALDGEMERLIHEALADVIKEGDNSKIMEAAYSFGTKPEFAVWVMGRFEGNMGAFIEWYSDALQNPTLSVVPETDNVVPSHEISRSPSEPELAEVPKEGREANSEVIQRRHEHIEVHSTTAIDSTPLTLSLEQESLIRETLSRYGTDEGLFQLAETDPDVVRWVLQRFNSPEELEAWHRSGDSNQQRFSSQESEERSRPKKEDKWQPLEGEVLDEYDE